MKQLYLFSGLGADERVFDDLDFPEYEARLFNGFNHLKMKKSKIMLNEFLSKSKRQIQF